MKKVVRASIGGEAFSLDEDAYGRLQVYFDHFRARLSEDSLSSQNEIMSDLEARIAELFQQGIGGSPYRTVDLDLVKKVVRQLGMPDGSPEPVEGTFEATGEPSPDFSYAGDKGPGHKRLYRDPDSKAIGGVCSGLGAFLNIDTTIVRIIALVALILYGSGLLIYIILWIVVPLAKTPAQKCEMRGLEPTAENMAKFRDYRKK